MTLHSYLLFVGASVLLVLSPGPDMLYMLGRCVAQGKKAGLMAALGFNVGGYVHLAAAVLGLSAILATSSLAFTAVKWMGAAYLVYLGVKTLRSRGGALTIDSDGLAEGSMRTIFWQAFWSDVLNPKVAMFFLALLPQFVDPQSSHPALQILLLGMTVNVIALPLNIAMVLASAKVTAGLRRNQMLARWLQKLLGAMFIALGIRLAVQGK